jgi:hypothetical protein
VSLSELTSFEFFLPYSPPCQCSHCASFKSNRRDPQLKRGSTAPRILPSAKRDNTCRWRRWVQVGRGDPIRPSALVNWKSPWRRLLQFARPQRSPPGRRQKRVRLQSPSYSKESRSSFIRRRGPRALNPPLSRTRSEG